MTEMIARVATTHIVQQGSSRVRVSREALESAAMQANGDRAIPITLMHDPYCLPIGKTAEAWVEPYEDEYALMYRNYIEDAPRSTRYERADIDLVLLDFAGAPKPFIDRFSNTQQSQFSISVDRANFDTERSYDTFVNDVSHINDRIAIRRTVRHSLGPEPLIEFVLSYPELSIALGFGLWTLRRVEKFVRYTIDETLRRVADDFAEAASSKIKDTLSAYRNRQSEDDRPVLIQAVVLGDVNLILLSRIPQDEEFQGINLEKLTAEMEKYGDLLQHASEATFAMTEDGEWKFLYLKTRTGEVIGTQECYEKTTEKAGYLKGISFGAGNIDFRHVDSDE